MSSVCWSRSGEAAAPGTKGGGLPGSAGHNVRSGPEGGIVAFSRSFDCVVAPDPSLSGVFTDVGLLYLHASLASNVHQSCPNKQCS